MGIGERLKIARNKRGYTQDSLASSLRVSRGVISNIEYEKAVPQPLVIKSICDILFIDEKWLLTGEGEMDFDSEKNKSNIILSEIQKLAQELSWVEQDYILEMIKTFYKYKDNVEAKNNK